MTGPAETVILLVEDDEMSRDALTRRLQRKGFRVVSAVDGPQALQQAREVAPDLILLELSLPLMDGREVMQRLRGNTDTRAIPIIAVTAHALPGERERALAAGADEFDTKPVDLARLLGKVEALLGSTPRRIVRPGRSEYLDELVEFTAQRLRESGADEAALHDLRVAVSEVCANVVEHGYTAEHRGSIAIETSATAECFIVRIEDDAPVFDPATLPPADTESDWERRKPGRLGWHLVYSVMDEVGHEPRGNRGNIVTLTKRIGPTSASAPEKG